jgi:hypothetical protein
MACHGDVRQLGLIPFQFQCVAATLRKGTLRAANLERRLSIGIGGARHVDSDRHGGSDGKVMLSIKVVVQTLRDVSWQQPEVKSTD